MSLPFLAAEDFPAVFEAIHGYPPFPWQKRLAESVAASGSWPAALDLPTGSGKTAAIDVALFHLALEADKGSARRAPARVAFVVDRRIIVDEAAERAARVAEALAAASGEGPLARMAVRLRSLAGGGEPLLVRSLRGGIPREDDWTRTPTQPTVLCSTVDQVGSRLLFRGYGVSDSMKPVHAGLLGSDCLFLLDEAHLAAPFSETLGKVAAYRAPPWCEELPGPWQFVSISATPRTETSAFSLDPDDLADTVLSRRLNAAKPACLVKLSLSAKEEPEQHAKAFTDAAERLFNESGARTLAVVVNRVALARAVSGNLRAQLSEDTDVVLLTGRTRGIERDALVAAYKDRMMSGAAACDRRLAAIATQTIEAGADFDFDALVTQIAPVDALRQRFGRLNRMGRDIPSPAAILAAKDEIASRSDDAVYGDRAKKTWDWLIECADRPQRRGASPTVDFGITAFAERLSGLGAATAKLSSDKRSAPMLRPEDVMLLSWTAPIPAVDPALHLFLHGPKSGPADAQIVWRADLTPENLDNAHEVLTLAPPRAGETLGIPVWSARAWLAGMDSHAADVADVEGAPEPEAVSRSTRPVFRWAGADSPSTGAISADAIRPGDVIVVPASYGGCDEFGWNPASRAPVTDLGDARPQSRRWVMRLHAELVPDIWEKIAGAADVNSDQLVAERLAVIASAGICVPPGNCRLHWPEGYDGAVLVVSVGGVSDLAAITEDDESGTLTGQGLGLERHGLDVEAKARSFAESAGLTRYRAKDVALAARLHDEGKADPRFQTWLRGGDWLMAEVEADTPLAKSPRVMSRSESIAARRAAGLPERWRHEAQSVTRAIADPRLAKAHDAELVLWLIGVHHGHGRPLFPHRDPREVPGRIGPQRLDFTYQGYDWPQIFERLKARYGPWELARMEAVVRLADHRASEDASR